jgi:hypothetical protein
MFDDHRRSCCRVRILLEKGPSRDHILKIRKIPEKYPEIIFSQKTQQARRRSREEPGGPTRQGGAASPLAAPALREGALAHVWSRPFAYIIVPENLSEEGGSELDTAASAGRRTQ